MEKTLYAIKDSGGYYYNAKSDDWFAHVSHMSLFSTKEQAESAAKCLFEGDVVKVTIKVEED
jgi:hypothetical protein